LFTIKKTKYINNLKILDNKPLTFMQELARGFDSRDIILGGFSQGSVSGRV
jgi:hypothetical protein